MDFAAENVQLRTGPALDALLRNGIRTVKEAGIAVIDTAYKCQLGAELITSKNVTGLMICEAPSVSALSEQLELDVNSHYFHVVRLYSVVKHIERHRQLPDTNLVPVSVWMGKQDKYKTHAQLFEKHRIADMMVEHIEPVVASLLTGLTQKLIRELKTDFQAALPKRSCIACCD